MILTNCLCPIKVECDCGRLEFDYYNAEAVSVLEIGNLINLKVGELGGECELDGYVIDWYIDGEKALVTGVGDDPDIQAFHPFVGEAAIPVIGGTYTPVVRYIIWEGKKIFPTPKNCQYWCKLEIDLPLIEVARLNCSSTNISGSYQYRLTYSSTDPQSLPGRMIAWDLPSDLSIKYFAIQFTGYDIADQIDVYFRNDQLLTSWIIGRDAGFEFNSMPYEDSTIFEKKFVIELPEYEEGDFLKIVISPAVIAKIPQTNWRVDFKCLNDSKGFDCDFIPDFLREIDLSSWSFIFSEENCRREFRVNMVNPIPNWIHPASDHYWFYLYAGMGNAFHSQSIGYSFSNPVAGVNLAHKKSMSDIIYASYGFNLRYASVGNVNLTKSGGVYTWTFDEADDYNDVLGNYNAILASTAWSGREMSDSSNPNYYTYLYWEWRARPANCGDTEFTQFSLYFHHLSTIVFNDTDDKYTLTITPYAITNDYGDESCNDLVTYIDGLVRDLNFTIYRSDLNQDSLCFEHKMFCYCRRLTGVVNNIAQNNSAGFSVVARGYTAPCLPLNGTCVLSTALWYKYIWYLGVDITLTKDPETGDFPRDSEGEYEREPCENFILYSWIGEDGCQVSRANRIKLLEIEDGVQIYPEE
ncbi:MAG: hypothetical protein BWX87_00643 [Bacteroidetes bacterium ADurb.Bin123]|jgi:hypothetical protein|nr:MAG: hypothetical protein BWX87_00643 [Bacteroidetes bacterium ADurb.Bin123]